ncbi:MAG TPA: 50S ribosomal protein L16 [Bacteroidia bacterium]|nr:50S ribosomal protein L16 [Sphingobacteriales bacterium]HPD65687.1 50S ribosomal protein L16 [Bacteroidia bacterium]HRS59001.1 50S ribosomal protein L16 [Bacteroidia bacterium]HRU68119.1 50S ribosomal protein L16 [Bacteroidia bacterium]
MLQPKKSKFRKVQKGRIKGVAIKGAEIAYGSFGLKGLEPARITSNQIEAARIAINRYLKREGKMWIRLFPDKPITKKPAEVRMGKGKGNPEYWVAVCKPGKIIFEIEGVSYQLAKRALELGAQKLPLATKVVVRKDYVEENV